MSAINTEAYAAVAARRFSGAVVENTATLTAKRKIEADITPSVLAGALPTTKTSIGPTMMRPPMIAKANRFKVIRSCTRRSSVAIACARPAPRLRPIEVLCCISLGLKEPSKSESRKRVPCMAGALRPSSHINAACSLDPRPPSSREAAISFTKCVFHRLP